MVSRCTNPHHPAWEDYGGRGITVCPEWMDFDKFYADMAPRPNRHELDRKDNELGYTKDNCHWVKVKQNARNTRKNILLELDGLKLTMAEWTERLGLSENTIRHRLLAGYSVKQALTTPKSQRIKKEARKGKTIKKFRRDRQ